ncbi:hypothetical protein P7M43_32340, partial [Vibrio parahaemolyticus]|nr:hypothetical protein [Vibrio parahaemolyticus]
MAAGPIRAKADGVEGAAQLRLVLGVPSEAAQLMEAVRELALLAVLARAALLEGPAQLGLVARGVDLGAA